MIKLTTPETDALDCELNNPRVLQDRYSEMLEHARKLERERDEAREAIQYAIDSYKKVKWGYDGCCGTSVIMDKLQDFLSKEGAK